MESFAVAYLTYTIILVVLATVVVSLSPRIGKALARRFLARAGLSRKPASAGSKGTPPSGKPLPGAASPTTYQSGQSHIPAWTPGPGMGPVAESVEQGAQQESRYVEPGGYTPQGPPPQYSPNQAQVHAGYPPQTAVRSPPPQYQPLGPQTRPEYPPYGGTQGPTPPYSLQGQQVYNVPPQPPGLYNNVPPQSPQPRGYAPQPGAPPQPQYGLPHNPQAGQPPYQQPQHQGYGPAGRYGPPGAGSGVASHAVAPLTSDSQVALVNSAGAGAGVAPDPAGFTSLMHDVLSQEFLIFEWGHGHKAYGADVLTTVGKVFMLLITLFAHVAAVITAGVLIAYLSRVGEVEEVVIPTDEDFESNLEESRQKVVDQRLQSEAALEDQCNKISPCLDDVVDQYLGVVDDYLGFFDAVRSIDGTLRLAGAMGIALLVVVVAEVAIYAARYAVSASKLFALGVPLAILQVAEAPFYVRMAQGKRSFLGIDSRSFTSTAATLLSTGFGPLQVLLTFIGVMPLLAAVSRVYEVDASFQVRILQLQETITDFIAEYNKVSESQLSEDSLVAIVGNSESLVTGFGTFQDPFFDFVLGKILPYVPLFYISTFLALVWLAHFSIGYAYTLVMQDGCRQHVADVAVRLVDNVGQYDSHNTAGTSSGAVSVQQPVYNDRRRAQLSCMEFNQYIGKSIPVRVYGLWKSGMVLRMERSKIQKAREATFWAPFNLKSHPNLESQQRLAILSHGLQSKRPTAVELARAFFSMQSLAVDDGHDTAPVDNTSQQQSWHSVAGPPMSPKSPHGYPTQNQQQPPASDPQAPQQGPATWLPPRQPPSQPIGPVHGGPTGANTGGMGAAVNVMGGQDV